MAEKSFGVKEINLIGASGTPTIESPNNLNLNAVNVAISTNVSIGGTLTVTGNVSVGGTLTYEDVTNIDSVGIVTAREGVFLPDNKELKIGNTAGSPDLKIYHDSSNNHSIIRESGTGSLRLQGNEVQLLNATGSAFLAQLVPGSFVKLFHDGSTKFETTSSGATVTGTLAATAVTGDGSGLTNLPSTDPTNTDVQVVYTVTANGSSAYRFGGNGIVSTEDNPDVYLIRGFKYRFINNSGGSHPFQIRQSSGGSAYSAGVTNNGASSGNIDFQVPYSAPSHLYYQCTSHSGMVGNLYIRGGASTANISNNSDNRVITGGSDGNLNGEANLTFDGSTVGLNGDIGASNNAWIYSSSGGSGVRAGIAFYGTSQQLSFYTAGSSSSNERLRINSSGNARIGGTSDTTNQSYRLTLQGSSNASYMQFFDNGTGTTHGSDGALIGINSKQLFIWNREDEDIVFATNNGIALKITDSRNIEMAGQSNSAMIHTDTSDGSDSKRLLLAGGGTSSSARGASIALFGNEYSGSEGQLEISAGNSGSTNGFMRFYTGGSERLRIDSSGRVIIGGTSPLTDAQLTLSADDAPAIAFQRTGTGKFESAIGMNGNSSLRFYTGADASAISGLSERMQIDASGRLLLGLTSDTRTTSMIISGNSASGSTGQAVLNMDIGTTSISDGTSIGVFRFGATGDRRGADIRAEGAGTWSAGSSHPTDLIFGTNKANTSSTPTERMRIRSDGHVQLQHGLTGLSGGGVIVCAAKSSTGTANQSNYKVDFVVPMGDLGTKQEYEDIRAQFGSGQTGTDWSHELGGSGILIATVQNNYYWGFRTKIYHITTYGNSSNNVTQLNLLHNYSAAGHGGNSAAVDLAVQSHDGKTPKLRATFSGDYWNSNVLTVTYIGSAVASTGNIRQLTTFDSKLTGQDPTWK